MRQGSDLSVDSQSGPYLRCFSHIPILFHGLVAMHSGEHDPLEFTTKPDFTVGALGLIKLPPDMAPVFSAHREVTVPEAGGMSSPLADT